jgi:hypothetical protein
MQKCDEPMPAFLHLHGANAQARVRRRARFSIDALRAYGAAVDLPASGSRRIRKGLAADLLPSTVTRR